MRERMMPFRAFMPFPRVTEKGLFYGRDDYPDP